MKKTLFWWYQRTIVRLVNYFLGKCNAILDRCYTYKRLRLINVLSEIRLFRFMTPFFVALKTLDAEMPVERYGRIQKNVIFFLMVFRFILDCFFGRIQELMVGPPPGLSDKRSFFGMLCGSVWPKSLFKISDEDAQWARDAIKKQEKIFKDMENRPHRLDTESVS